MKSQRSNSGSKKSSYPEQSSSPLVNQHKKMAMGRPIGEGKKGKK
jgi:hypothetical protein